MTIAEWIVLGLLLACGVAMVGVPLWFAHAYRAMRKRHEKEWRALTMRLFGRAIPRPSSEAELYALVRRLEAEEAQS